MNRSSGTHCAVFGCTYNRRKLNELLQRPCYEHFPSIRSACGCGKPFTFHGMPADPDLTRQWLTALRLKNPPKQISVCSFHFVDKKPTKENPVPQLYLGYERKVTSRRVLVRTEVPTTTQYSGQSQSSSNRKNIKRLSSDSSCMSIDAPEDQQTIIDELMYTEDNSSSEQLHSLTEENTDNHNTRETSQLKDDLQNVNDSNEDFVIKLEVDGSDSSEESETERRTEQWTAATLQLKEEMQEVGESNGDSDMKVESNDFDYSEPLLNQTETQVEQHNTAETSEPKEEIEEEENELNEDSGIKVEMNEELFPRAQVITINSVDASTQWVDFSLMDHQYTSFRTGNNKSSVSSQTEAVTTKSVLVQYDGLSNTFETIIQSDKDSKFFTGLPKATLLMLIKCVEQYACPSFRMYISDQILMLLMKLKLNLMLYDISKRFGVSLSLASHVLNFWIDTLGEHLKHLVVWLPRETIAASVPDSFRVRYPKTTCIIGCAKILIETGSHLDFCDETKVYYKSRNSRKYLVGIAPSGTVMFVSCAYGGDVSDSFIASDCGILNHFTSEEEVMADCEFTVGDLQSERRVGLVMPAYIRGINVKHATRRMKMFKILSNRIPQAMVSKLSKILQICGALVNILTEESKDKTK